MTPTEIMDKVRDAVYKHFGLSPRLYRSKSFTPIYAEPRRFCLFFCREMGVKVSVISSYFNTSQTEIASANETVTGLISNSPVHRSHYKQLTAILD